MGDECWDLLHRSERSDLLEVGCGAGRFTEILLSTNAFVTSVDMSAAVEANQDNCPQGARHRLLQADVFRLPFAPQQYDVVFCLGVVQHTPIPSGRFEKLYEQVRPGGWLVIDHYTRSLSEVTKAATLYRMIFKRLPPEQGLKWSRRLVETFLPYTRWCAAAGRTGTSEPGLAGAVLLPSSAPERRIAERVGAAGHARCAHRPL